MLRQLAIDDMDRTAVVHRMSFDHALPTLAGLHTPDEDRWFFRERMFATCQLWGCFDENELLGFIAFRDGWIDQLYVSPSSQCRGIGTALLQIAQSRSGHLSLWTFQRNKNAVTGGSINFTYRRRHSVEASVRLSCRLRRADRVT